jgi:hypothetical protein
MCAKTKKLSVRPACGAISNRWLKIQKPSLQIEKKKRLQFEGCHGADQMP